MSFDSLPITEAEEQERLHLINQRLRQALDLNNEVVHSRMEEVRDLKRYLSESKADMDHLEKISVRQSVDESGALGEHSADESRRLVKLLNSAYFGRIDYLPDQDATPSPVYIGIHSFYDDLEQKPLIHDWRAPISSVFYDFEIGPVRFRSPQGLEQGRIDRKRQYRIEKGKLVFLIESSLNIQDQLLQNELRHNASEKMKNIVATIQRDQNQIVRNESSHTLVIQGAAGSGKTSIALHRVAFLLYRFKDSITSSDVLILSPNKVFANYISNVLPELGEENIGEFTMEELASELLDHRFRFESFYDQVSKLLQASDPKYQERVEFKSTSGFLSRFEAYIQSLKQSRFTPGTILIRQFSFSEKIVEEEYHRLEASGSAERINQLVEVFVDLFERNHRFEIKGKDRSDLRKQITKMFDSRSLPALYKGFFAWNQTPKMIHLPSKDFYEYADVFPLIYLAQQIEGIPPRDQIKHLVIDEMQDYTPLHYAVLSRIFPCKKTILGDANQSVNLLSSSDASQICEMLETAESVFLNKSYRSTIEISNVAQKVRKNENLIPIERHGPAPEMLSASTPEEEVENVRSLITAFLKSDHQSCGVLCKTQELAQQLFDAVHDLSSHLHLLTPDSSSFPEGVIIAAAYLAKGLEFDEAIIPHANEATYHTPMDQQMLYVAITRAMHRLTFTYTGKPAIWLR
ncbi:MAG: HelD family protein [Puniceicoccaceae bacterium]